MQYKIGITEAGDAGLDLSWADKLWKDEVDGAVIITKNILSENFLMTLCDCFSRKQNIVLHSTITGLSLSLEPHTPCINKTIKGLNEIICDRFFPRENIVIRVDPIIPTPEGIEAAKSVIKFAAEFGYKRFRISIIDMYPHVRERFKKIGYPLPYGDGFAPSTGHIARVDKMLFEMKEKYPWIFFESCAEKGLHAAIQRGCISDYDLSLMNLDLKEVTCDSLGYQRKDCMCYSGKVELLKHKNRCPNKCAYCYWKD